LALKFFSRKERIKNLEECLQVSQVKNDYLPMLPILEQESSPKKKLRLKRYNLKRELSQDSLE
jgi:hypothetical protein